MATPETYMEAFISVVEEIPLRCEIVNMVSEYARDNEIMVPDNISISDIKTYFSKEVFGIKVTVSFPVIKK